MSQHQRYIRLLIGSWILGAIVVFAWNIASKRNESRSDLMSGIEIHPLADAYQRVASALSLSPLEQVSFTLTKELREDNFWNLSPVFQESAQKYDLLIFGDSSTYGLIPSVIERSSGLKVGVFGWQSQYLNRETIDLIRVIARHYLKKDGSIALMFDYWTIQSGLDASLVIHPEQVRKIGKLSEEDFGNLLQKDRSKTDQISFKSLFQRYRSGQKELTGQLRTQLFLQLPAISFYEEMVPNQIRDQAQETRKRRLIHAYGTSTYWVATPRLFAVVDDGKPIEPTSETEKNALQVQQVADYLSELDLPTIFVIHASPYDYHYYTLRDYAQRFKLSRPVINLGAELPPFSLPMENGAHMANESGFYFSHYLGKKLRNPETGKK